MLFPCGKYTTLPLRASVLATSFAASIRRSSIKPGPAMRVASEISLADSLSPSALMTAAFLSCHNQTRDLSACKAHVTVWQLIILLIR